MIRPTPSTPSVTDAECVALTRSLRRRGTVVLSVFALVWAFAGASGLASSGAALAVEIIAVPVTAAALFLAYREGAAPSPRLVDLPANWARSVGIVNVVELAAIFGVIAASNARATPRSSRRPSRWWSACTSSRWRASTTSGSTRGRPWRCAPPRSSASSSSRPA
ncbi:hypothetical protein ACFWNI_14835 [Streptomyces sp. NPDC058377]|uniref:hypothetical protein n=1 Tax=Streptomyces sp. NPDC058377 TaxID=3346468 RepID=UPI00364D3259